MLVNEPFTPVVPDPNQLSIPSEEVIRGSFSSRLKNNRPENVFSMAQFSADRATEQIGTDITLSSVLEQLDLPANLSERGGFSFPVFDIADFFDSFEPSISELDLKKGQRRDIFGLSI